MEQVDTSFILQTLLGEFYDKLSSLRNFVEREIAFPDAPGKIKVIIGMRRTGKTYFVYQHILKLLQEGVSKKNILYINFEDDRLVPLDQEKMARLIDAFYSLYPENHKEKTYLFFDEIQSVPDWPLVVRRLYDKKNVELYLTGSSAKLLSKEIATSLRGRSLAIEMWPYSFTEFMRAKKIAIDRDFYDKQAQDILKQAFNVYLVEGGFPELVHFNQSARRQTLQEYIDVTAYRDIVERYAVKHPMLIKYMLLTLLHGVGQPFTLNKFYNDLKSQGYRISKDALYDYAHYIEDAYTAFFVPIYDRSIRKVQTNPKKLYAIDPGLVRAVTLSYNHDFGKLFENVIYLDLKRKGYAVHYYLTGQRYEVDFLSKSPDGQEKLWQVAWNTEHKDTLAREKRALQCAKEALGIAGELVTLDSYLLECFKTLRARKITL